MSNNLPNGLTDCLLWSEELGMGYHPRPPIDYDGDYFSSYRSMDATPTGAALTRARVDLVRRHFTGDVIDIGIGGGRFVEESNGYGFDVNPTANRWLNSLGRLKNPYEGCDAISCWDSLEHIPDPEKLIRCVREYVFVSMPIYLNSSQCLTSKHFKPGEHIWYFTQAGLIAWFQRQGFELLEQNAVESLLGRQDIMSFAFRRVN